TSDSFSGALVRVCHSRLFLGRLCGVMDHQAGVWAALNQLCSIIFARMVLLWSIGAFLLLDCGPMAGICQLFHAGFNCELDHLWPERAFKVGLAATLDC